MKETISGIYSITNTRNNKVYIGESLDIKQRWDQHRNNLIKDKHHNQKLQEDYFKYGLDVFEFKILYEHKESRPIITKATCIILEEFFIKRYRNKNIQLYNSTSSYHDILFDLNKYYNKSVSLKKVIINKSKTINIETKNNNIFISNYINVSSILRFKLAISKKVPQDTVIEIIKTLPSNILKTIIRRKIEYIKNGEHIIEYIYLTKDIKPINKWIEDNRKNINNKYILRSVSRTNKKIIESIDEENIPYSKLYNKLIEEKIIPEDFTYHDYKNYLLKNNIIKNAEPYGVNPTEFSLSNDLVYKYMKTGFYFNKKGVDYIMDLFSNIDIIT